MKREHFVKVVEEALDSLPQEFRSRIRNVAVFRPTGGDFQGMRVYRYDEVF